jgi:hypothetical protein
MSWLQVRPRPGGSAAPKRPRTNGTCAAAGADEFVPGVTSWRRR